MKPDKSITKREDKLLFREKYYRKARLGGFITFILLVIVYLAYWFIKYSEGPVSGLLILAFISFATGYESHIRIRHIETIKHYRAKVA